MKFHIESLTVRKIANISVVYQDYQFNQRCFHQVASHHRKLGENRRNITKYRRFFEKIN